MTSACQPVAPSGQVDDVRVLLRLFAEEDSQLGVSVPSSEYLFPELDQLARHLFANWRLDSSDMWLSHRHSI